MRTPSFFIIGAAKAGTTSLFANLQKHPQLFFSELKEPHFFSDLELNPLIRVRLSTARSWESYLKLFERAPSGSICGEASTSYLWSPRAPRNILSRLGPDCRFVAILRDPISRAYSNFLADVREGLEDRSFKEAIHEELANPVRKWGLNSIYIGSSMYSEGLQRYIDTFGPQHLKVVYFDDLLSAPNCLLGEVTAFIGARSFPWHSVKPAHENAYGLPKSRLAFRVLRSGMLRELARLVAPESLRARTWRSLINWNAVKPELPAETSTLLREIFAQDVLRTAKVLEAAKLVSAPPPWLDFFTRTR